jgi:hypothetical protein
MRTTVTLPDELIRQSLELSGKRRLSDAIRTLLTEEISRRKRLKLLDLLAAEKPPHDPKKIKAARRGRRWSA